MAVARGTAAAAVAAATHSARTFFFFDLDDLLIAKALSAFFAGIVQRKETKKSIRTQQIYIARTANRRGGIAQ